MNLGYCVVFHIHEQGLPARIVVVTSLELEHAQSIVEDISGYPREHKRYQQEVFDLTSMYHRLELGELDDKELRNLQQYSPESVWAIKHDDQVDFTVQAFSPLGTRHWINRRWDEVVDNLNDILRQAAQAYKEKRGRK